MSKIKKFFATSAFILSIAFIGGLFSDWSYFGLTDIFVPTSDEQTVDKPSIKPLKKPNLQVENVFFNPKSPKVGDTIDMIAKIKNIGEQELDVVKVKFSDQNGWGQIRKASIKGDLYKYVKVELQAEDVHVGEHKFIVEVDSNELIDEENENDNKYQFQLEVTRQ